MTETSTIEMRDRELFAAMAMQALITRGDGRAADMIAKQAVAYADALIEDAAIMKLNRYIRAFIYRFLLKIPHEELATVPRANFAREASPFNCSRRRTV